MKSFITQTVLAFALSLVSFAAIANHGIEPVDGKLVICDNEHVEYTIAESLDSYIDMASYSESRDYFSLKTFKKVEFLQILNSAGELEFQLPINENLVHISLSDFDAGAYKINLKFENQVEFMTTEMIKK